MVLALKQRKKVRVSNERDTDFLYSNQLSESYASAGYI